MRRAQPMQRAWKCHVGFQRPLRYGADLGYKPMAQVLLRELDETLRGRAIRPRAPLLVHFERCSVAILAEIQNEICQELHRTCRDSRAL